MELKTNLKNDESLDLNGVYSLEIDKSRNGNLNLTTIGKKPKVVLEFQNAEEVFITDKEFLQEINEDEIFSVIGSFLNRLKPEDWARADNKNITLNEDCHKLIITDKTKSKIIKKMIKDFKRYKN